MINIKKITDTVLAEVNGSHSTEIRALSLTLISIAVGLLEVIHTEDEIKIIFEEVMNATDRPKIATIKSH